MATGGINPIAALSVLTEIAKGCSIGRIRTRGIPQLYWWPQHIHLRPKDLVYGSGTPSLAPREGTPSSEMTPKLYTTHWTYSSVRYVYVVCPCSLWESTTLLASFDARDSSKSHEVYSTLSSYNASAHQSSLHIFVPFVRLFIPITELWSHGDRICFASSIAFSAV